MRFLGILLAMLGTSGIIHVAGLPSIQAAPQVQPNHLVEGRFTLPQPDSDWIAARANRIAISGDPGQIASAQAVILYRNDQGQVTKAGDPQDVTVMHDATGYYVEVQPDHLGSATLTVTVTFADGGLENEKVQGSVTYPDISPDRLYVSQPWQGINQASGTIALDLNPNSNHATLLPIAVFGATGKPITIPPKDVDFKILTMPGSPSPLTIERSRGLVKATGLGHALIVTKFHGVSTLTCVNVMGNRDDGSERTDCSELVPPGTPPPPSDKIAPSLLPRVKPRPH